MTRNEEFIAMARDLGIKIGVIVGVFCGVLMAKTQAGIVQKILHFLLGGVGIGICIVGGVQLYVFIWKGLEKRFGAAITIIIFVVFAAILGMFI